MRALCSAISTYVSRRGEESVRFAQHKSRRAQVRRVSHGPSGPWGYHPSFRVGRAALRRGGRHAVTDTRWAVRVFAEDSTATSGSRASRSSPFGGRLRCVCRARGRRHRLPSRGGGVGRSSACARSRAALWLILPVVICLSQRLSHACLSTNRLMAKPRMAH